MVVESRYSQKFLTELCRVTNNSLPIRYERKNQNYGSFPFVIEQRSSPFKLVGHKSEVYEHNIKELELLKDQLDNDNNEADGASENGTIKIV